MPTGSGSKPHPRRRGSRGRRSKWSEIKELLLLLILNREGPIGRYRLKDMLDLSEHEGVVRQMLASLQKQGHVSASRSGSALTQKGKALLEKHLKAHQIVAIKTFDFLILKTGSACFGVHLQKRAD